MQESNVHTQDKIGKLGPSAYGLECRAASVTMIDREPLVRTLDKLSDVRKEENVQFVAHTYPAGVREVEHGK